MNLKIFYHQDALEKLKKECINDETPESLIYHYFHMEQTEEGMAWDESIVFPDIKNVKANEGQSIMCVMKIDLVPLVDNITYYPIYGVFAKLKNETILIIASKKDAQQDESILKFIEEYEKQKDSNN